MNRALPEMMHYRNVSGNGAEMTVLERQRDRMKWQQEQDMSQQDGEELGGYFGGNNEYGNMFSNMPIQHGHVQQFQTLMNGDSDSVLDHVLNRVLKSDPDLENGWQDHGKIQLTRTGSIGFHDESLGFETCGYGNGAGFPMSYGLSRTNSCLPENSAAGDEKSSRESALQEKLSSATGRESFKKRKADKMHNPKVIGEDDTKDKKIKICAEEGDSKITEQTNSKNKETSTDTSKENSKVSEVHKQDYIHVRARRGQATDSHSLAERVRKICKQVIYLAFRDNYSDWRLDYHEVRREKISERMKYLQDLVPGCNKITGKAGMLDEIINYVQSLQRQVEFLSMKLAAVNPRLDLNIENLFAKEVFPASTTSYQPIGVSSEMANPIRTGMQFNPLQQLMPSCEMEMGMNLSDMGYLRRTTSAPLANPETFFDTSSFSQIQPSSTWDAELQNIYNLEFQQPGRSTTFVSQQFTGSIEASNLKMEM